MPKKLYRHLEQTPEEVLMRAEAIANANPDTAYISRASSQYVRDIMRKLLDLYHDKPQPTEEALMTIRNRVELLDRCTNDIRLGELSIGQMFQHPGSAEDSVYMRVNDIASCLPNVSCVLLSTGCIFNYPGGKQIVPLSRGRQLTITQGG